MGASDQTLLVQSAIGMGKAGMVQGSLHDSGDFSVSAGVYAKVGLVHHVDNGPGCNTELVLA